MEMSKNLTGLIEIISLLFNLSYLYCQLTPKVGVFCINLFADGHDKM